MFGVLACLRARVLGVLTCLRARRTCVLACLVCLPAYVLGVLTCLRACVCQCVLGIMKCLIFLRVCVLGVLFLSYLLCISILKFKNSHSKKLCASLGWTYSLFTFWYQLKQYQFFTVYIFTCYINFCCTHCFCLIYCQSSYWLLLLLDNIPW